MKRALMILAILSLLAANAYSRPPIRMMVRPEARPDSVDLAYYGKKHFGRAALTVLGLNTGVWAYDRFVQKGDFSYISFNTIKQNFKHLLIWDNDHLGTNMFLHPYHGSLYFNAARSNGFNYWQSSLFAVGGSALWEFFMECEYPSTNDIICTPIGGMALGEVTYRFSDMVLDDRATGWGRFGREAAGFVISPMREVTRIINGDAWRRRATSGRQFEYPNLSIEMSMGLRALEFKGPFFDTGTGFTTALRIEYGDRYACSNRLPYDYFYLRADLNVHSSQPLLDQFNILGRLIGTDVISSEKTDLNLGLYQHFDFYDSDTISAISPMVPYRFATPASFGAGAMGRQRLGKRWEGEAFAHVNAVILAGVLSDHYYVDERDYNLASGFSIKTGASFVLDRDKFSVGCNYEYFRLFTLKGYAKGTNLTTVDYRTLNAQGDPSVSSFIVYELRADYRLWRRLYATAAFAMYTRSTHYDYDLPYVRSTTTSTRFMLTYKF